MNKRNKISFTEYRDMLVGFERIVNVDYHACVGAVEKSYWADRACRSFSALESVTCCKEELVRRFERTADISANRLTAMGV